MLSYLKDFTQWQSELLCINYLSCKTLTIYFEHHLQPKFHSVALHNKDDTATFAGMRQPETEPGLDSRIKNLIWKEKITDSISQPQETLLPSVEKIKTLILKLFFRLNNSSNFGLNYSSKRVGRKL